MFDLVPPHQHIPQRIFDTTTKINDGSLYLRQQHTVIELVEVSPPPPRRITSVINSSSAASSSYSSSSSSSFDDEEEMEVDNDDEEEEEICSSYCSSDFQPDAPDVPATQSPSVSDSASFARRMKRVLVWRALSEAAPSSSSDSSSLKRKLQEIEEAVAGSAADNDDAVSSHSSKRSRSVGSAASSSARSSGGASITSAELNMHPCPACDAFFPTLHSLRLHGTQGGSEACCVAVEYAFEQ